MRVKLSGLVDGYIFKNDTLKTYSPLTAKLLTWNFRPLEVVTR